MNSIKWQKLESDEYILIGVLPWIVATVFPGQGYGKYTARVENMRTHKVFTYKRNVGLATAKRQAKSMAIGSVVRYGESQS